MLLLVALASPAGWSQTPLPDDFDPGANATVACMAVQADGKIVVGGQFTMLGGQPRNYLGRLNPDGSVDMSFNPGASSGVSCLALQTDGKILVGGSFTNLAGQARDKLGRLNPDGTLDNSFNPGANDSVYSFALQADGKILVGGGFSWLGGYNRSKIARLNADGSVDTSFNPGAQGGPPFDPEFMYPYVDSLAIQPDGKILVGGEFTILGGQRRSRIGRLNPDGSLDTSFNPGANAWVHCLAVQADGKILVGGTFTNLAGQARDKLGRLNPDGTLDMSFNAGVEGGSFPGVSSLVVQTDGKILVGGIFTNLAGQARENLGRLHPDGSVDMSFNPSASSSVSCLALQSSGKVLVGGNFTNLDGQPRIRIGQLNNTEPSTEAFNYDSATLTWLRGGSGPEVWRTAFSAATNDLDWVDLGQGERIAGGWRLSGVVLPPVARVRARGHLASSLRNGSAWFVEAYLGPPVLVGQPESRINDFGTIATFRARAGGSEPLSYQWHKNGLPLTDGGLITGVQTSTLTLSHVSKADEGNYTVVVSNFWGSVTSAVATLTVRDPAITRQPVGLETQAGQFAELSVAAVGTPPLAYQWRKEGTNLTAAAAATLSFTNVQVADAGLYDVVVSNIYGSVTSMPAWLAVNGAKADAGFNPSANFQVRALAIQADRKILAGGSFTSLGGQPRNRLGRLNADGTLDLTFNPGADGPVYSLALQPDGKILVGGLFSSLAGQPRSCIGRLNADGTLDLTFNPGAKPEVLCLALQADGKMLVGGAFTNLAGLPRRYLGRLNPDGTPDSAFDPRPNAQVDCVALQADGKILIGGAFTSLAGQSRKGIGRLNQDGSLDSTFNPDANPGIFCLAVQADGKILAGGSFTSLGGQPRNYLGRLNPNGTLDLSFNPGADSWVFSLTLQTDGKILLGGLFTRLGERTRHRIGRLNPDGTVDLTFNPGANGPVNSLAMQADGKILAGGAFSQLGGEPRGSIGRLDNTEPAIQSLDYQGGTATWLRSGSSPEVWRTTFGAATNGLTWVELGTGQRINGGWQLAGLDLPAGARVRARGHLTGGQNNGSAWFVEAYFGPPLFLTQPRSRTNDLGTTATFQVLAGGSEPLSYQWQKDGLPLADGNKFVGAQTPTLTVSNVLERDAGGYAVVVSNAFGSVTSAVATLTVRLVPTVRFVSVIPRTDGVELGLSGVPGQEFTLQGSPDLSDWANLGRYTNHTGTLVLTNSPPAGAAAYFYRTVSGSEPTSPAAVSPTLSKGTWTLDAAVWDGYGADKRFDQ